MAESDFTIHTQPETYSVAVYWPGEGYGGAHDFQTMKEAEACALKYMEQGTKQAVHLITRTVRVFARNLPPSPPKPPREPRKKRGRPRKDRSAGPMP
jgi:hypothetical protein